MKLPPSLLIKSQHHRRTKLRTYEHVGVRPSKEKMNHEEMGMDDFEWNVEFSRFHFSLCDVQIPSFPSDVTALFCMPFIAGASSNESANIDIQVP